MKKTVKRECVLKGLSKSFACNKVNGDGDSDATEAAALTAISQTGRQYASIRIYKHTYICSEQRKTRIKSLEN